MIEGLLHFSDVEGVCMFHEVKGVDVWYSKKVETEVKK